jgi:hypothetical protein
MYILLYQNIFNLNFSDINIKKASIKVEDLQLKYKI